MYSMNEQEVLLHVNHYQNPIPLCNCKTDIRMAHPCHACCASSIVSSQSYTDICLRRPCSLRYRNDLCRYSQNSSGGLTLRSLRDSGQSVQQLPCQGQKSGLRCTLKASLWSYGGGEVSSYMKLDEHWPAEIILCDTIRYDTIWYDMISGRRCKLKYQWVFFHNFAEMIMTHDVKLVRIPVWRIMV